MCNYLANFINNIENKKYLELGIYDGRNINQVRSKDKISVDVSFPSTYQMTTDKFFETIDPETKFDVIYIDACHNIDYVVRDWNNSINHLSINGIIFTHDMIPPSEEWTKPQYCGTSFKLLNHIVINNLMDNTYLVSHPKNGDYGLTCFFRPEYVELKNINLNVTYSEYLNNLNSIKLYSTNEMQILIKEKTNEN